MLRTSSSSRSRMPSLRTSSLVVYRSIWAMLLARANSIIGILAVSSNVRSGMQVELENKIGSEEYTPLYPQPLRRNKLWRVGRDQAYVRDSG